MRATVLTETPLVASFAEWRAVARELLLRDIPPHAVRWITPDSPADLFSDAVPLMAEAGTHSGSASGPGVVSGPDSAYSGPGADPRPGSGNGSNGSATAPGTGTSTNTAGSPLNLPRELIDMLQSAACFRAPDRWAFLYQVLWRWRAGEREVMSIADPDGHRLRSMVKSVRREEHDMHAYVRFRERPPGAGAPRFVAWFEPSHDVLPQVARHFAKRMGGASWMIATPDSTVVWNGEEVRWAPPMVRDAAMFDDAGERLWLTYYASIFNPSRLNTTVMHSHIPSRFWTNLPEGKLVPALVSEAANGGRRNGQAEGVGRRKGTEVKVSAEQAAPLRHASMLVGQDGESQA